MSYINLNNYIIILIPDKFFSPFHDKICVSKVVAIKEEFNQFYVYGSVHRESMSIIVQKDATMYSLYFCKFLYMFRVVTPPIIRSTYNCNHSI